jgi:TPR repeat protein
LKKSECVSIDFQGAAHYFKLAADQGYAHAQFNYGMCLYQGEGVSINFQGTAHYSNLLLIKELLLLNTIMGIV